MESYVEEIKKGLSGERNSRGFTYWGISEIENPEVLEGFNLSKTKDFREFERQKST